MKRFSWILLLSFVVSCGLVGCGRSSVKVDTKNLAQSFQSAPAKSDIDQVVAAIDAGDYAKAVPILMKVIKAGGLSQEQKDGITTAVAGMQMVASQNPNKYSPELYRSLSDLIGSMESQPPAAK